jgi:multiple sugar transport system ATP-binding protein
VQKGGEIHAAVYTMELLGDATMITVRVNGEFVSVKATKDYRAQIGEMVRISVPKEICHLFDPKTGARIGG